MLSILATCHIAGVSCGPGKRVSVRSQCCHHPNVLCEEESPSYGHWGLGGQCRCVQPLEFYTISDLIAWTIRQLTVFHFLTGSRRFDIPSHFPATGASDRFWMGYPRYRFHHVSTSDHSGTRYAVTSEEYPVDQAAEIGSNSMERNPVLQLCGGGSLSIYRVVHSLFLHSSLRIVRWRSWQQSRLLPGFDVECRIALRPHREFLLLVTSLESGA